MTSVNIPALAWLCLAAAYSGAALAAVDLDATTPAGPVYARETLNTSGITTGLEDGATYYHVNDAGNNNDVLTKLGAGFGIGDRFYVRFDLDGGVLTAGSAVGLTVDGSGANILLISGGSTGESFVIYSVVAGAGLSASAPVELALDQVGIASNGAVAVSYALYESVTDAIYRGTPIYRNEYGNYIRLAVGAYATFTRNLNEADVDEAYRSFTSASVNQFRANVGTLEYVTASPVFSADDGAQVQIFDVVNELATTVTLSGDFSFGRWSLDEDATCSSPDVDLGDSIDTSDYKSATALLRDFGSSGYVNLCVEVDGIEDTIPAEEYIASAEVVGWGASRLFPPANFSGAIGQLERNGTIVKLPYLTTFGDYSQRIVLVNYRDIPVDYSLEFLTEEGVSATALDAASGTLAPNAELVLKVEEVVALSGGSRCAAILSATARVGSISVATTQVTLSDGSSDTVVY